MKSKNTAETNETFDKRKYDYEVKQAYRCGYI